MLMFEEDMDAALNEAFQFLLSSSHPAGMVISSEQLQPSRKLKRRADTFSHCMMEVTNGRLLFYTENCHFGVGQQYLAVRDKSLYVPARFTISHQGGGELAQ
jgi:hypothetical protein